MSLDDKEELISVIVPVYNVENYLERCLDSILVQTYSNYEVLLIDDGSKDNSGRLCDQLASRDNRISVYHKKNGGLGSARNYGIQRVNGVYVCFIDSDDKVEPDYLENLYLSLKAKNADISVCGYYYAAKDITSSYEYKNAEMSAAQMLRKFGSGDAFFNFAWNKLYKKTIFDQMPMYYSDKHCAEDMYFNAIYYRYVDRVATVKKPLYTYYVNMESLSNGRRPNFWEDMLLVYDEMLSTCKSKDVPLEYADTLLLIMFRNSVSNFCNKKTTLAECKEYIEKCIIKKNVGDLKIAVNSVSRLDRMMYWALIRKQYALIYVCMRIIKWVKIKHFKIFCKIRQMVSRR